MEDNGIAKGKMKLQKDAKQVGYYLLLWNKHRMKYVLVHIRVGGGGGDMDNSRATIASAADVIVRTYRSTYQSSLQHTSIRSDV